MAAHCLHEHVKNRLNEVLESILHLSRQEQLFRASRKTSFHNTEYSDDHKPSTCITSDSLIIGALENAFVEMDKQILEEKMSVKISGGCAAIVSLVFLGKVFVANAGDCRAILVTPKQMKPLSNDFNPVYERKRLQYIVCFI